MITRYTYKSLTWLDVANPSVEEVREFIAEAGVPVGLSNDLTVMVPHSDCHAKKGVLKLTLDWPIVRRTDISHPHEVKFLVTKTHLITIRFEEVGAIQHFAKEFEVHCLLQSGTSVKNKAKETTPVLLFLALLSSLYKGLYNKLDYLQARLYDVEDDIFNEKEREMVSEISHVTRRLITFRQTITAHENALKRLRLGLTEAFGSKYAHHVDGLEHHYRHILRHSRALTSTAVDLRNTNVAMLSTKENEIMKMLTVLAFITFPLTLFTSTFGMNTVSAPIIGMKYDFWIIIGIMCVVSITLFVYFKYKKWI